MPTVLCNSIVDDWRPEINLGDTDRADGEGSAANRGAVWDEDRKLRETSRLPSHPQRQQTEPNENKRTDEATRTVARIARLPKGFGFEARARLVETNADTNLPPSAGCRASNPKVRSHQK